MTLWNIIITTLWVKNDIIVHLHNDRLECERMGKHLTALRESKQEHLHFKNRERVTVKSVKWRHYIIMLQRGGWKCEMGCLQYALDQNSCLVATEGKSVCFPPERKDSFLLENTVHRSPMFGQSSASFFHWSHSLNFFLPWKKEREKNHFVP